MNFNANVINVSNTPVMLLDELQHAELTLYAVVTSKGSGQPALPCSLIRVFPVCRQHVWMEGIYKCKMTSKTRISLYTQKGSREGWILKITLGDTLKCLSIGTPNTTTFPFVPDEKWWLLGVPIFEHIIIRL